MVGGWTPTRLLCEPGHTLRWPYAGLTTATAASCARSRTVVWKLIEDDCGTVELFDLQSDPEEETNLASRHRMRVETMRAELGPRQPQTPRDRDPAELSEESLERLRSLGYVR